MLLQRSNLALFLAAVLAVGAGCAGSGPAPERRDILLAPDGHTVSGTVPPDATLETILKSHDIDAETAAALVSAMAPVFNPRQLRADQRYEVTRADNGQLRELRYEIDATKYMRVTRTPADGAAGPEFTVKVQEYPRDVQVSVARASLSKTRNSLSAALDAEGENIQLALLLWDVFGGLLDFNSDLQPGDRFDVMFDKVYRDGEFVGYGDARAATMVHGGKTITAVRVQGPDRKYAWYDSEGRSMRRQFLASPLEFNPRITSRFSMNRKHPVYGFSRAHLGVDYAAPTGSRVLAVSPGTVVSAGWSGDSGIMVHLRHSTGYETYYLHLSKIAAGIVPGAHVDQKDVVGYVGATGAATGPHLDFRIRRSGVFVNPVLERQRMPPGEPIPPSMLAAFQVTRDQVLAELTRRLASHTTRASEH